MATPLKSNTSNNIKEFTTSEENYIAHQIGLHLAAADSAEVGSLNKLTSGTTVGSYSNSFFNQPVGTHPAAAITTGTTTTTLYQTTGTAAETDSDFSLPIMWVDSGGQTGFKQMPDLDLNAAVDRYLTTIFTNDYPGAYRLGSSSPGAGWSVQQSAFTDTRTDGTSVTYNLYKKTSAAAPTVVRPMYVEDSAGGSGMAIKEMSDRKIKQTFGQRAKTRINSSKIGTYQLRSSAQGAPTDPGTWVAKGTATDTKQQVVAQTFTRDSTVAFAINYTNSYTRNYTSNYTKLSQITYTRAFATVPYQRLYTSEYELIATESFNRPYTTNYTSNYVSNYTRAYTGTYDIAYVRQRNITYTGGNYQKEFALAYVPNYDKAYTQSYIQNYVRNYTGTKDLSYQRAYTPNYIRAYTPNYIRDFANSFTAGYARDFANSFVTGYARDFANSFTAGYVRNFVGGFAAGYQNEFAAGYQNEFAAGYARDFANSFAATYNRDFANSFVATYNRDFANSFTAGYARDFAAGYQVNYTRQYTGNYTRFYSRVNQSVYSGAGAPAQGLYYVRTGAIMAYYTRAENFPIFHPSTPGTENVFYARLIGTDQPNFYVPNYIGYNLENYVGPGGQYLRIQESFTPIYRSLSAYTGAGGTYVSMKAEDVGYGDLNYTSNRDVQFVGGLSYSPTVPGEAYYARTFPAGFFQFDNSQGFYTGPPTLKYLGPFWAQYQKTYTRTGLTVLFETFPGPVAYLGQVRQTQYYEAPTGIDYLGFDANNTTWSFQGNYQRNIYTRNWGGIYYVRNFAGYARNYLGETSRYQGEGYLGDANYAGDYDLRPIGGAIVYKQFYVGSVNYTRAYAGNYNLSTTGSVTYLGNPLIGNDGYLVDSYTRAPGPSSGFAVAYLSASQVGYTTNYTRNFVNNYVRNYTRNFVGGYVRNYTRNFVGGYVQNYTRNFVNNYVQNYVSNYVQNYVSNYVQNYTRAFTNNYVRNYTRNFVNNYVRNYTRNFVNNYVRNYTRNFQTGYVGAAFSAGYDAAAFLTNYVRTYTGNFATGYQIEYNIAYVTVYTGPNYTRNYTSNYDAPYVRTYTSNYTTIFESVFVAGYQNEFATGYVNNYIRAYTGTYVSNYINEFANQYTGNYVGGYLTDYIGNYQNEFADSYISQYEQNYIGNFIGNFEGDTIDSSSEIIETYTLYVRIA